MRGFHLLAWATIILAMLLLLLGIFWIVYPYQTMEVEDFVTTKAEYKSGDEVVYNFEYSKFIHEPCLVYRQLINGVTYPIDSFGSNLPKAQFKLSSDTIQLPMLLKPDTYILRLVYVHQVNPLRTISKEFNSKPFCVK